MSLSSKLFDSVDCGKKGVVGIVVKIVVGIVVKIVVGVVVKIVVVVVVVKGRVIVGIVLMGATEPIVKTGTVGGGAIVNIGSLNCATTL